MAGRSKWIVVGGAAAFAVTPLVAFAGSSLAVPDIPGSGVMVDIGGTKPAATDSTPRADTGGTNRTSADTNGDSTDTARPAAQSTEAETVSPVSPDSADAIGQSDGSRQIDSPASADTPD